MSPVIPDPNLLREARQLLLARQADLRGAVQAAETSRRGVPLDRTEVGDHKDLSVLRQSGDLDEAEQQRDIDELQEVDAALARLAAGRYGECVDCGEPIAARRLLAQPSAQRCVRCQAACER